MRYQVRYCYGSTTTGATIFSDIDAALKFIGQYLFSGTGTDPIYAHILDTEDNTNRYVIFF